MINSCDNCGSMILQEILEAGVPALCPACGPLYSVAKAVSNSNKFSAQTRDFAAFACTMALVFAGAIYLDKIIDSFNKS